MQTKTVVAALIVENKKVLIARRALGQSHALKWEFPGGKVEPNETPQMSLAREIQEELGFEIVVGDFCASNRFQYKDFIIELSAYWATRTAETHPLLSVHDDVRFVDPEELRNYDLTQADVPIMEKAIETLRKRA
jgi:8-oxo-dGTP diphosphatase